MKKYMNWLMVGVLAITGLAVTSCKDEPDKYEIADGKPTVYYVRSPYLSQKDSLLAGAYMGNTVCLVGDNLRSIVKLFFNDQEAVLNTSFITDHTLLCDVPSELPETPTDKIYMITQANDTVTFDFSVMIPSPTVNSISCEFARPGDIVTIYGDYLLDYDNAPLSITMPGGIEVTEFESISKTSVSFAIPDGAVESGYVYVTSKYGTGKSKFYFKDDRCMLFDWDGSHGGFKQANGWRSGAALIKDDGTGIDGAFMRFNGTTTAEGWNLAEDDWCFNYWPNSNDPAFNTMPNFIALYDRYGLSNLTLKFEYRIPSEKPWTSAALQVMLTEASITGTNSYYWDTTFPRAIWQPYASTGSYDTGGEWVTVSLPLSIFNKTHTGDICSTNFTINNLGGLTFYFMGGTAGVAGELQLDVDNIRIAPVE